MSLSIHPSSTLKHHGNASNLAHNHKANLRRSLRTMQPPKGQRLIPDSEFKDVGDSKDLKMNMIPQGLNLTKLKPNIDVAAKAVEAISMPIVSTIRLFSSATKAHRTLMKLKQVNVPLNLPICSQNHADGSKEASKVGVLIRSLKRERVRSLRKVRVDAIWRGVNALLGGAIAGFAITLTFSIGLLSGPIGVALIATTLLLTLSATMRKDWFATDDRQLEPYSAEDIKKLQSLVKEELAAGDKKKLKFMMPDGKDLTLLELVGQIVDEDDEGMNGVRKFALNGLSLVT